MKKKVLMVALFALVSLVAFTFANTVNADQITTQDGAGKVDTITATSQTEGQSTNKITLTYNSATLNTLKWVESSDGGVNRGKNGWWIGFKVTAPDAEKYDAEKAVFNKTWYYDPTGNAIGKKISAVLDGENYAQFWVYIDNNIISANENTFTLATYTYDWTNDGTIDLTVEVKVDPKEVNLTENATSESRLVKVTINGKVFTLLKGKNLDSLPKGDKEALELLKKGSEEQEFIGFFKEDGTTQVKETDVINEDTVLTAKFKKIEKATTESKKDDKKDETPKTGYYDMVMYVAIIVAVATLAGTVVTKKAINNK